MILLIIISSITIILLGVVLIILLRSYNSRSDKRNELDNYKSSIEESNRRLISALQQSHTEEIELLNRRHEQQISALREEWNRRLEELNDRSRLQFRSLSEDILSASVSSLRDDNTRQLEATLTPLRQQLQSLASLIHQVSVDSTSSTRTLSSKIEQLASLNDTLGREAHALTQALRGDSKIQGDWGENILETILEKAGLVKGVNFHSQVTRDEAGQTLRDEQGALQRPDFVVDLPGGRHIIIDSKVSLTAYVAWCETDDKNIRRDHERKHLASVKSHINELGAKQYQKTLRGAVEQILMFIPNEGAYRLACEVDSGIWQYAHERGVVMVTPALVLSAMMLVGQLWREDAQDRNAAEIARIAGLLYDSFVDFNKRLGKVGDALDSTQKLFNDTRNMLNEGQSKSLLRRAGKLRELGAKTSKKLDETT